MRRLLAGLLFVAALTWAGVILASPRFIESAGTGRVIAAIAYLGASQVCHQRADRSFHAAGRPLPVCARCTGLYLAAPVGLLAGLLLMRRRRFADDRTYTWWRLAIVLAALPTVVSVGLEWVAGPGWSCNVSRALTAVPLGAAVAALAGAALSGGPAHGLGPAS